VISFKQFLKEKIHLNDEWFTVILKSGAEIQLSIKLLDAGKIALYKANDKDTKVLQIGSDPVKTIEDFLGEELNLKDPEIIRLLKLITPCNT